MKFSYMKCRPKMKFPFLAWVIMFFQGMVPWDKKANSHRALGFEIDGNIMVIDSTGDKGVEISRRDRYEERYIIVEETHFEKDITFIDFDSWVSSIDSLFYDKWQLVGMFFKLIGLISFNFLGSNFRRLTCNEVFLYFAETFYGVEIGDPDNWDLRMTDKLASEILGV